jgi:hypothetical protein
MQPYCTASQPDRQRAPVTFIKPKYKVAEIYFRGFCWNSIALCILPSFSHSIKTKQCYIRTACRQRNASVTWKTETREHDTPYAKHGGPENAATVLLQARALSRISWYKKYHLLFLPSVFYFVWLNKYTSTEIGNSFSDTLYRVVINIWNKLQMSAEEKIQKFYPII